MLGATHGVTKTLATVFILLAISFALSNGLSISAPAFLPIDSSARPNIEVKS